MAICTCKVVRGWMLSLAEQVFIINIRGIPERNLVAAGQWLNALNVLTNILVEAEYYGKRAISDFLQWHSNAKHRLRHLARKFQISKRISAEKSIIPNRDISGYCVDGVDDWFVQQFTRVPNSYWHCRHPTMKSHEHWTQRLKPAIGNWL